MISVAAARKFLASSEDEKLAHYYWKNIRESLLVLMLENI